MAHILSAQSVDREHVTAVILQRLNVAINLHPRLSRSVLFVGKTVQPWGSDFFVYVLYF